MSSNPLTIDELRVIKAIERSCSVISVLACFFIMITFCTSRRFHKPINRLVFYASFGNLMTSIGGFMSRDFTADVFSPGCQVQAFLIQMFMPADTFWTLAMATNVYLSFYRGYDMMSLRRMEIPYFVLCYGLPFIPALVFVFVPNSKGDKVYGDAILWCWISSEWATLRMALFYAPVWAAIILTFFIYIRAGRTLYENHKTLQSLGSANTASLSAMDDPPPTISVTQAIALPRAQCKTTPIQHKSHRGLQTTCVSGTSPFVLPCGILGWEQCSANHFSIDVETMTIRVNLAQPPQQLANVSDAHCPHAPGMPGSVRLRNHAAWSYAKASLLFFLAMLITWIPSSANRMYSIIHRNQVSIALQYMSAFVLPLQGLWNAIIYAVTSHSACKSLFYDVRASSWPKLRELIYGMRPQCTQPVSP